MEKNNTPPIRAYIENARDSSIGGFTIPLPTTTEVLTPWLVAIGAEDDDPFNIAIREIRSPISELEKVLQGFGHDELALDELNYLAAKVGGLNARRMELFAAALENSHHFGSVKDLLNFVKNIDCFDLQPAFNEAQYGEVLIQMGKDNTADVFERLEQSGDPDERELARYILRLEAYVDGKAYGRGVAREEDGVFTSRGYLVERGKSLELYHGPEDIPMEYCLFTCVENERSDEQESLGNNNGGLCGTDEKLSVIAKIREAQSEVRIRPPAGQQSKLHDKSGPEL